VDYSFFIVVMMVETLEKVEIAPAAAPVESPLPPSNFYWFYLCFGASVLLWRSLRGSLGKSFI
jgi:hypothetical protein